MAAPTRPVGDRRPGTDLAATRIARWRPTLSVALYSAIAGFYALENGLFGQWEPTAARRRAAYKVASTASARTSSPSASRSSAITSGGSSRTTLP
jgi:hypothetical protein